MTTFWESTDWAATGSCLQAIAGFASAAAIIYAARKGLNTFAQWRRQRQADRQIAVAERVLTLVYRAKDAFRAIRSPAVFSGELSQAEESLEQTIPGTEDPSRRLRQNCATQGFVERILRLPAARASLSWDRSGATCPPGVARALQCGCRCAWLRRKRGGPRVSARVRGDDLGICWGDETRGGCRDQVDERNRSGRRADIASDSSVRLIFCGRYISNDTLIF